MTARYYPVRQCMDCAHRDHKGAFGHPAYVPVCRAVNRELPYTIGVSASGRGAVASQTDGIPDWCPLPVMPEGAE